MLPGCAPWGTSLQCPPSSATGKAHFHFLQEQNLVTSQSQPLQGKPQEPQEEQAGLLFAIIPDGISTDLEMAGWDVVILELVAPRPSMGKAGALQSSGKQGSASALAASASMDVHCVEVPHEWVYGQG